MPKPYLRSWVTAVLAVTATVAGAQVRLCSQVPAGEREFVRSIGACRDAAAPILDVAPGSPSSAPLIVMPVPTVVGLTFDAARARLTGFDLRRSYRASAEPGGTVLAQDPAAPARLAAGATVRVVLSDGSLRPPPRVAESEVDGLRQTPAESAVAPPTVSNRPQGSLSQAQTEPAVAVQPGAQPRSVPVKPAPVPSKAMSVRQPSSRTRSERVAAPRTERSAPVTEVIEVPNVVGRSDADASRRLVEFKVDRIEVVASAAPSGQVLAQEPAPGTSLAPGGSIGLRISDGSLAAATATAAATPSVSAPSTPAATEASTAPAATQDSRSTPAPPGNAALILLALVLLGLVLGALLMRRRALAREVAVDNERVTPLSSSEVAAGPRAEPTGSAPVAPVARQEDIEVVPAEIAPATATALAAGVLARDIDSSVAVPEVKVFVRVEPGETTIQFAAPSEADEAALEQSRELHE